MAKKVTEPVKGKKTAPKKENKAPKMPPPAVEPETVIEDGDGNVVTAQVNPSQITPKNMVGRTNSKLDANHRVELLSLAKGMFHDDPDAVLKYGETVVGAMDKITACGIIAAIADEATYGDGTFAQVLRSNQYPLLEAAASDMGIKIPSLKALPAGKEEGTVVLPSNAVEVSEEAKEKLKEEKKVIEGSDTVEIDPKKVAELGTEEALIAALKAILIPNSRSKDTRGVIADCVEFMKAYRIAQKIKAGDKENEAEKEYESRTYFDWLNDAFSYITPTFIFNGIGTGLIKKIDEEKSPISAFIIMKNALNKNYSDKDVWDDKRVAEVVKAIVLWKAQTSIAAEEKALAALAENDKNNKDIVSKFEAEIAKNKEYINIVINPNFDIVDGLAEKQEKENGVKITNKTLNSMFKGILVAYYGKDPFTAYPSYKNIGTNVQEHAGIIVNLFRSNDNQNLGYSESNLTELVKYTEEEFNERVEELRKKNVEERKAAVKKDLPFSSLSADAKRLQRLCANLLLLFRTLLNKYKSDLKNGYTELLEFLLATKCKVKLSRQDEE